MQKLLLLVTGSVAVEKILKLHTLLKARFRVKVLVSDYVYQNFNQVEALKPLILSPNLASFPEHITLVKWADLIVVAPASANTLAKFHAGIADNTLLTVLLAARSKIIFVPAMNTFMYQALEQRGILNNLQHWGHLFLGPTSGHLKEGEVGLGRMLEPETILKSLLNYQEGQGKKVIVSYGASKVYIDPIRFLSNDSSGMMGKLIMDVLRLKGYQVQGINLQAFSNHEVLAKLEAEPWDTYISVGAFADVTLTPAQDKIKKGTFKQLNLKPNLDVLQAISQLYPDREIIGFKHSAKREAAIIKKQDLNLSFMVWNQIGAMGSHNISGEIIGANFKFHNLSKAALAAKIGELI